MIKNTIGLNIMATKGESEILDRCLSSVNKLDFIDKIYVLNTSEDRLVTDVAKKYTNHIYNMKWVNDFGFARNFILNKTDTEFVIWLDADDILEFSEESKKIWQNVKKWIFENHYDGYLIDYHIPNELGIVNKTSRCRIFKNYNKIQWHKAVHEYPTPEVDKGMRITKIQSKYVFVLHNSVKKLNESVDRNMKILESEYNKNPEDPFYHFYYARCLHNTLHYTKSIPLFKKYIDQRIGQSHNLYYASYLLASYYNNDGDILLEYNDEKFRLSLIENYCRIGLSFCDDYAEIYCLLGDVYFKKNRLIEAIEFYNKAFSCKTNTPGFKEIDKYREYPARQLMEIYFELKQYEQSLLYCKYAIDNASDKTLYIKPRKQILSELLK